MNFQQKLNIYFYKCTNYEHNKTNLFKKKKNCNYNLSNASMKREWARSKIRINLNEFKYL